MFRHHGKTRNLSHNLRIASLLSFVAGLVNTAGFFAVQRLTTNVTGHFAFFMDEVFRLNFWSAFILFFYVFFFFLGSFVSNLLIEIFLRKNERYMYVVPTLIETTILLALGIWGKDLINTNPNLIAFSLLFAMGLQNSFVTSISKSIVRTTHLTGLFTDLGIELSQLFFYKEKKQKFKLYASIRLRFTIILFFFFGGIIGGILYTQVQLKTLIFGALMLIMGLIYDTVKFRIKVFMRSQGVKKSRSQEDISHKS